MIACRWPVSSLLIAVALSGCGADGPPKIRVHGVVTHQDQPVDHGIILFVPASGETVRGPVAADGGYEVQAPAGEYRVAVSAPGKYPEGWDDLKDGPPPPDPDAVPDVFARPATSGLTASIRPEGGPLELNFELK
mgnify:CR=1 FL=1